MASNMYDKLLPDYGDPDNKTGTAPGYRVYVLENDGGVSIQMLEANKDLVSDMGHAVFMNVEEARELVGALQNAIDRAAPKNANHPSRARD